MDTKLNQTKEFVIPGLSTIALMKANYDEGKDYIDMFQPFILDSINKLKGDSFELVNFQKTLKKDQFLDIPIEVLKVLLSRTKRNGFLRKEQNRYYITNKFYNKYEFNGLDKARKKTIDNIKYLGKSLVDFARERSHEGFNVEDALEMIISFLANNEIDPLLGGYLPVEGLDGIVNRNLSKKETIILSKFIENRCKPNGLLLETLKVFLEGFILQNVLLLKDIGSPKKTFDNLTVYFDSGFLLSSLGYQGNLLESSTKETIELLKEGGCYLRAFKTTINEIIRILGVYEKNLKTIEGKKKLYKTPLTKYFLENNYTSSDIQEIIKLIDKNIENLGIKIVPTTKRKIEFTYDEEDLAKRLSHEDDISSPRVKHDVDCAASIITKRSGYITDNVEDARAVFITDSNSVAKSVNNWYRDQKLDGIPPFMHYNHITNIAWLKNNKHDFDKKIHEISAICHVALNPSEEIWDLYNAHLDKLKQNNKITNEEEVLLVLGGFTEEVLLNYEEFHDKDEIDKLNFNEVVKEVKNKYREEGREEIKEDYLEIIKDKEAKIKILEEESEEKEELEELIDVIIKKPSKVITNIIFLILIIILILLFYLYIYPLMGLTKSIIGTIISVVGILGLIKYFFNWTPYDLKNKTNAIIESKIKSLINKVK